MIPTEIKLLQKKRVLELQYENGEQKTLSCAYLRAHSPSAENRNKAKDVDAYTDINIIGIDPVGNYGIKLIFDDGHNTGIYQWEFLYKLGASI